MRKYRLYLKQDIINFAMKNNLSASFLEQVSTGDSSTIFNVLYNNQDMFISAGMKIEDYFYSELYWICRYLYEVTAKGEEAPDFEASIIDVVNYFIIALEENYGEDLDSEQVQDIDRMLEKEFHIKRPGSFV
ncbi:hypothetical protein [Pseudoflavonifractor phocaeensis]|uniref:hypothetical protein n=1 Tax=Pseudoflavonifractor phocaeensis TaxID=1870988 RepID=UPI00195E228D|nr:hypothetical protein [Pseudoflavonifractor phocaeensis]MBM6885376.1 hypothetical protein [Pseudoflavonifractor phocaeensis]